MRNDTPLVVEKVDETTVKFVFGGPNGLLLQYMATPANDVEPNQPGAYPRHYMEQFHPKYNPNAAGRRRRGRHAGLGPALPLDGRRLAQSRTCRA